MCNIQYKHTMYFLYTQYIYNNVALKSPVMSDIFWYTYAGLYGGCMHMSEITESQDYMYV